MGWAMILLMILTYMFSVFLTQVATDARMQEEREFEELSLRFGNLVRSFLTLYQVISEGLHWHEVVEPLRKDCSPWIGVTFVAYVSFALFVLMNIITSTFVDGALRTGEEDRKKELMRQMEKLIDEADEDGSGTISWEEFESHLKDPQMQVLLKAIDFDQDDAKHLFKLLDVDETGEIPAEGFISGCLRLSGTAKAVELAAFMSEFDRFAAKWETHCKDLQDSLRWIYQYSLQTVR